MNLQKKIKGIFNSLDWFQIYSQMIYCECCYISISEKFNTNLIMTLKYEILNNGYNCFGLR